MTKLLEQAVAEARTLPDDAQDDVAEALFAHIAGRGNYQLTAEQIEDVKRIRQGLATGETRLATHEEEAAVWKKTGQ